MRIKTYVINLKESVDRRERVLAETEKYPCMDVELVEAVDGKSLSQEEKDYRFDSMKFVYRMGRTVFPGEIGCTLSHRECYHRFVNSEEEVALVLEDDVCFFDKEHVDSFLQELSRKMMKDKPCIITLTRHRFYFSKKKAEIGQFSIYRVREAWGTCAYLMNKEAARKMLSIPKSYFVADDYLLMGKMGICVQGVHPLLAMGASEMKKMETTVWEEENVTQVNTLKYWMHLYSNGIYRRILLLFCVLKRRNYKKKIQVV